MANPKVLLPQPFAQSPGSGLIGTHPAVRAPLDHAVSGRLAVAYFPRCAQPLGSDGRAYCLIRGGTAQGNGNVFEVLAHFVNVERNYYRPCPVCRRDLETEVHFDAIAERNGVRGRSGERPRVRHGGGAGPLAAADQGGYSMGVLLYALAGTGLVDTSTAPASDHPIL